LFCQIGIAIPGEHGTRHAGPSIVAGEAVGDGGTHGIGEGIGTIGSEFHLDAAEAPDVPGSIQELAEGECFDGAPRVEFGKEGALHFVEFLLFSGTDDMCLAVSP
jgi:hypothetical protein